MAALFAFAAVLQINDPDPIRWMTVYGLACGIAARAAANYRVPLLLICAVALVALVWAARLEMMMGRPVLPGELFQAWQMKDNTVELARETGGLIIVAVWMLVTAARVAVLARRQRAFR